MSRVASLLKRASGAAVSGLVLLAAFGASHANADPCVEECRGQHNCLPNDDEALVVSEMRCAAPILHYPVLPPKRTFIPPRADGPRADGS